MTLAEAIENVLALHRAQIGGSEWESAVQAYYESLAACQDPAEIARLLEADTYDDIPIPLKSAAFERLLETGGRSPAVLRQYADHLWLHGPDWDDLAEALVAEAERLEAK